MSQYGSSAWPIQDNIRVGAEQSLGTFGDGSEDNWVCWLAVVSVLGLNIGVVKRSSSSVLIMNEATFRVITKVGYWWRMSTNFDYGCPTFALETIAWKGRKIRVYCWNEIDGDISNTRTLHKFPLLKKHRRYTHTISPWFILQQSNREPKEVMGNVYVRAKRRKDRPIERYHELNRKEELDGPWNSKKKWKENI